MLNEKRRPKAKKTRARVEGLRTSPESINPGISGKMRRERYGVISSDSFFLSARKKMNAERERRRGERNRRS
jgi:hypothetical protein